MGAQIIRSIHLGMGEIGVKRLKLYAAMATKRGKSLSALIVEVVDKDLGINLPRPSTVRKTNSSPKK
jgi:hypothetical protein